ncbi:MAG: hypothetical protein RLZZ458_3296 [Planctomycetota bacterium]|jgi:hypothetical protein
MRKEGRVGKNGAIFGPGTIFAATDSNDIFGDSACTAIRQNHRPEAKTLLPPNHDSPVYSAAGLRCRSLPG